MRARCGRRRVFNEHYPKYHRPKYRSSFGQIGRLLLLLLMLLLHGRRSSVRIRTVICIANARCFMPRALVRFDYNDLPA